MNKIERIWTVIVGIVAFLIRYLGEADIAKKAKICGMGADMFISGCGWYRFLNGALIVISIAFVGYFIYYNYEELKKHTINFLEKIKK